jgi:hypothetical protein
MKKILAVALLGLVAVSANAAGTYKLVTVNAYNLFSPSGTSTNFGPIPNAGTAVVDGGGNVSATGIQHSFANVNSTYNYTAGVWSAVVGGTSVTHTETCVELAGTVPCTSPRGGLSGLYDSTNSNGGAPSPVCIPTTFFPSATLCDNVSIVEVAGVSLTITEQSEFAILGSGSGYIYRFVSDADNDGIVDTSDNCRLTANPLQQDANADGFGNICDADINNSGTVTTADFGLLRSVLGQAAGFNATSAASDMNSSGTVTTADFGLLRARLGTAPGPSGLACAGTPPCPIP